MNNQAAINQGGEGYGYRNNAHIDQDGGYNLATVNQVGHGNNAHVSQRSY